MGVASSPRGTVERRSRITVTNGPNTSFDASCPNSQLDNTNTWISQRQGFIDSQPVQVVDRHVRDRAVEVDHRPRAVERRSGKANDVALTEHAQRGGGSAWLLSNDHAVACDEGPVWIRID